MERLTERGKEASGNGMPSRSHPGAEAIQSGRTREERTPKAERCRLASCPFADKADDPESPCAACTGPVVWKETVNGRKETHGRCRSCTNCPMNGAGLPVCWAACPGPNQDFTTDGESMVTLGSMENPDSYVEAKQIESMRTGDEPDAVRRMIDAMDRTSTDDDTPEWSFAGFSSLPEETRAARIAEKLIAIDGKTMEMLLVLHHRNLTTVSGTTKSGRQVNEVFPHPAMAKNWARVNCRPGLFKITEDRRTVAEYIGCDIHSVTDDDGIVSRIFSRLSGSNSGDWDSLRARAMGYKQTETAKLMMITKQAVSKRDKKIAQNSGICIGISADESVKRVSIHQSKTSTCNRTHPRATK